MSDSHGFSLIEVLCAILILGVALVGLTQGITTALSSHKESELQAKAAWLAVARIEMLRAEGYLVEGSSDGAWEGEFDLFQWRESVKATATEGLYEVEVAVHHGDSGAPLYELRTLLFEAPITATAEPSDPKRQRERRRR